MATMVLPGQGRQDEPEWVVWLTVAVALGFGLLIQAMMLGRTAPASVAGAALAYPASWVRTSEPGAAFAASDLNRGGASGARVALFEAPRADLVVRDGTILDAAANWTLRRGEALVGYQVLAMRETTAAGRPAASVEYAYLASSPLGSAAGAMPTLMHGIDTVVESGDRYRVLAFATAEDEFEQLTRPRFPRVRSVYDDLLASWRVA